MIRGILTTLGDGAVRLLAATGRFGETFSRVSFLQHYGFASRPKAGAEILVEANGNVTFCIASDDRRYRLALADGEAALYDHLGQKVHLKADGSIEIVGINKVTATAPEVEIVASTQVTLTTPLLQVSGNITSGGDVSDQKGSIDTMRQTYNSHTHPDPQGGATAPTTQAMS